MLRRHSRGLGPVLARIGVEGQELIAFKNGNSTINVYSSQYAGTNQAKAKGITSHHLVSVFIPSRDNICYVIGIEDVRVENRGSILRDFVAGKSPMAFEASILIHFIHKSALYFAALLKSSIVSL